MQAELIETRLEERDGGTWITGICPLCWERFGFMAVRDPRPVAERRWVRVVRCPNDHELRIVDRRSAGTRVPGFHG